MKIRLWALRVLGMLSARVLGSRWHELVDEYGISTWQSFGPRRLPSVDALARFGEDLDRLSDGKVTVTLPPSGAVHQDYSARSPEWNWNSFAALVAEQPELDRQRIRFTVMVEMADVTVDLYATKPATILAPNSTVHVRRAVEEAIARRCIRPHRDEMRARPTVVEPIDDATASERQYAIGVESRAGKIARRRGAFWGFVSGSGVAIVAWLLEQAQG